MEDVQPYFHFGLSIDCVIFGFDQGELKILLIKRREAPFDNTWALPGNLVSPKEELEQALQSLKNVKGVVADPLYRPVCPENVTFYELPHIAFSGRIYKKKLPVLAELI